MELATIYEIIGYIASALVAISLMMSSILRLRIINLIGAAFFTLYGLLIGAYPVAAVNAIIVIIDLYYLHEIYTAKEYFTLLEVQPDSSYLAKFLSYYKQEIDKYIPNYSFSVPTENRLLVLFILRNMVPAGLFIGEFQGQNQLFVKLDFVIPGYRDFKIAEFLYTKQADIFRAQGVQKIYSRPESKAHVAYLKRMGFTPQPNSSENQEQLYYRTIR